jgi:hypothetical protein
MTRVSRVGWRPKLLIERVGEVVGLYGGVGAGE